MGARYGCCCFAVPRKLLEQLADTASDGQGERDVLLQHVAHSSHLRGQRAAAHAPAKAHARTRGEKPLHRQVFDAHGSTMLPGTLLRDEDDPPTRDAVADQAYDHVGIALQFFKTVLGRDSVDGKGLRIDASVHYGFGFPNAMWTGEQLVVGDGDGKNVRNLAGSLGIIAHEFSHGVSQHLVKGGLGVVMQPNQPPQLKGEAGALNESFSDVCASMIKQWHAGQDVDKADWLLGEDILTQRAGRAVRSLKDPGNRRLTWAQDDQISDYRRYRTTMDSHTASGIANHAFYLAATAAGGRSWETLGAVWLQAYGRLRARATFLDAAHATVAVAATLHGNRSAVQESVKSAWKKVNVLA